MPKQVLVVEDDKALARSLARLLEEAGYGCRLAVDGMDALEQIEASRPDIVIMDLLLPKKDGHGLLADIRGKPSTREIPIVAISGVFRGRATANALTEAGAQAFLEKPFQARALLAKISELIGPAVEPTPEEEAARGDLAITPAIEVFWKAVREGYSGALHFQRGKVHKILMMREGRPMRVRSNAARECLGRRLMAAGRIDQAAHDRSLSLSRDGPVKQGEALVEMGLLTSEELARDLERQAADKLLSIFAWSEGEFWRQESVASLTRSTRVDRWSPRATLLHGASQVPREVVERRLEAHADDEITRCEDTLAEHERAAPGAQEALRACRSGATPADLMGGHGPALYGLWLAGVVAFGAEKGGTAAQEQVEAVIVQDEKVQSLEQDLERLRASNYFEILQVDRDADSKTVRKAFLQLAKRYHPDRFSGESSALRDVSADIFALLSNASDTLCEPKQRREYITTLDRGARTGQDQTEVLRIIRAEAGFRDAEAMVKRRDFSGAVAKLEETIGQNPREGDFHSLLGWARFRLDPKNEESVAVATAEIEKGIALAPGSAAGYYFMAKIRRSCDDEVEARRMIRKVLDIDPGHVEANREMRLLKMREKKSGGGLFGFGRKKP